jgi:hypothetical protein
VLIPAKIKLGIKQEKPKSLSCVASGQDKKYRWVKATQPAKEEKLKKLLDKL